MSGKAYHIRDLRHFIVEALNRESAKRAHVNIFSIAPLRRPWYRRVFGWLW